MGVDTPPLRQQIVDALRWPTTAAEWPVRAPEASHARRTVQATSERGKAHVRTVGPKR